MTGEAYLTVRLQPRASNNQAVSWSDGVLRLRLTAPPVDGAANRACTEFLAQLLGVRRAQVTLVSGEKSRDKRFRIAGQTQEALNSRLAGLASTGNGSS